MTEGGTNVDKSLKERLDGLEKENRELRVLVNLHECELELLRPDIKSMSSDIIRLNWRIRDMHQATGDPQ
jgi:predicted nuclease with TOPRIM domain